MNDDQDIAKDTASRNGGSRPQHVDPEEHKALPPKVRDNQLAATVQGYRTQVIEDGIPSRYQEIFTGTQRLHPRFRQTLSVIAYADEHCLQAGGLISFRRSLLVHAQRIAGPASL